MLFSCFNLHGQKIQLKSGVVATAGISDENFKTKTLVNTHIKNLKIAL
jgi:hypothetical protein